MELQFILVIDDDQRDNAISQRIVRNLGYQACYSMGQDLGEVVAKLRHHNHSSLDTMGSGFRPSPGPIVLILIDYCLGRLDGVSMLRAIRSVCSDIPVIFLIDGKNLRTFKKNPA